MEDFLEDLKDVFIAECYELLDNMERDLLLLGGANDIDLLNSIFRGAHSIKGGAGALSLTPIYTFTHSAEALLDVMRSDPSTVTPTIIDILLNGVDIVRKMVDNEKNSQPIEEGFGKDVLLQIEQQLNGGGENSTETSEQPEAENSGAANTSAKEYIIQFRPHRSLFSTGNDPIFIFSQLENLGELSIEADLDNLPELEDLIPDECFLCWNISLKTEAPENTIREAFEFVEDHADLIISTNSVEESEPKKTTAEISPAAENISTESSADKSAPNESSKTASSASEKTSEKPATAKKSDAANEHEAADKANASVRVDVDKIDRMVNMVGELVIAQSMFVAITDAMPPNISRQLERGLSDLSRRTRELQEAVMAVRMQPVKSIFSRMTRLSRDLSRQLNKPINLEVSGENTEIDKTIIEKLSDPLTHMIRNAADHGLESPEKRLESGKSKEGNIRLAAFHAGGKIVIEIEDDGAGINRPRVLEKAKSKGLVPFDAELSSNEIDMLIFLPGFSTVDTVSTISGRGVGMDVVDKNIKELGGSIAVMNNPGKGAKFTITLPLTLAILDGMVVCVGTEKYIVPIISILETFRPRPQDIKTIADGSQLINIRGEFIPILYLHSLFDIREAQKNASDGLVLILESGRNIFGVVVDSLLGQQQVVIKSIADNTESIPGISGATILGDGKISLILDIAGLHQMLQSKASIPNHSQHAA